MRIIDEITQLEIENPDLSVGELRQAIWASPEAYKTIDNVTKFALADDDYEEVQIYHIWTDEDISFHNETILKIEKEVIIDSLPDAVADLSQAVSDTNDNEAGLADAIAELSEIVSNLVTEKGV